MNDELLCKMGDKEVSIQTDELYVLIFEGKNKIAHFPLCDFFDFALEMMVRTRPNTGSIVLNNSIKRRKLQAYLALHLADPATELVWDRWQDDL